jgi:hypothetical protein
MDKKMLEDACDKAHSDMLKANAAQPYVHEEYARHERLLKAALMLWTDGDAPYAAALFDAYVDSNEELEWYVRRGGWSRDDLVQHFGHDDA